MASGLLLGIEPQPDFPRVDMSESNARLLMVMLANRGMLKIFHETAESNILLFRLSHLAVSSAIDAIYDREKALAASIGVAIYEAASALVNYNPVQPKPELLKSVLALETEGDEYVTDYLAGKLDTFQNSMPQTAEVVAEAAGPLVTTNVTYAILGAAVARDIEIRVA